MARRGRKSASIIDYLVGGFAAVLPPEPTKLDKMRSYADDPVGFGRDILGVRLWKGQRDLLLACRDHEYVACVSGQKIGKTMALVVLALWDYTTHPGARVHFTAPAEHQLKKAFWRELRMVVRRALAAGWPIPGGAEIAIDPRTGLQDPETFSEIIGFVAREIEAVSGISGRIRYLVDEASGVSEKMFEGMLGNLLGGGSICLISNPSRSSGTFFQAFKGKDTPYHCLQISSEETPNCTGEEPPIVGLADPKAIAARAQQWGRDSVLFKVRVLGQFVVEEEGKMLSLDMIEASHRAWLDNVSGGVGRLIISCDPAGDSGEGDESGFGVRRGQRMTWLHAMRGLTREAHVEQIRDLITTHKTKRDKDKPVVIIDREGPIGSEVWGLLNAAVHAGTLDALIVGVRSSENAARRPADFDKRRDEMHGHFRDAVKAGAELPPDGKLDQELLVPGFLTTGRRGRVKATDKKEIRKILGRSPDRMDTCILAFWFVDLNADGDQAPRAPSTDARDGRDAFLEEADDAPSLDPYNALSSWG